MKIRDTAQDHVVAIATHDVSADLPSHIRVLFLPLAEKWNDFTFQVRSRVGFRSQSGEFQWTRAYLAFRDEKNTFSLVRNFLVETERAWIRPIRIPLPFISILENVRAYQLAFECLGDEATIAAIEAHDLALAEARRNALNHWSDAIESEVFNRAFMRRSETAFAYENADEFITSRTLDAEDSSQTFTAEVKTPSSILKFAFEFGEWVLGRNRIAVLIGKNGCGKTTALLKLSQGLAERSAKGVALDPRPRINQVVVFAHSRSVGRFRKFSTHESAVHVVALDPTMRSSDRRNLVGRLAQIIRFGGEQLTALVDALSSELPSLQVLVPMKSGASTVLMSTPAGPATVFSSFSKAGEQLRLDLVRQIDASRGLQFVDQEHLEKRRLSLGQDVFLTFAINALSAIGPASVLLIDEPENFLHPNLVSGLIKLIHRILDRTKSIAIIATHSPFVVREMPRSQVHVIADDASDSGPTVSLPRMQTFGANVGTLSDAIFGDDLVDRLSDSLLDQLPMSESFEELVGRLKDEVSFDALMELRNRPSKKEN